MNHKHVLPIRVSKRAKRMSLVVHEDTKWEVVVPAKQPPSQSAIVRFVNQHQEWLLAQQEKLAKRPKRRKLHHRGISRTKVEAQTRILVHELLEEICTLRPFTYKRVKIGNFSSQWGSCTREKNLSFHYKLSLLPRDVARYIVAHELAHTVHFNHSKRFWSLVDKLTTNSKAHRKTLRQIRP